MADRIAAEAAAHRVFTGPTWARTRYQLLHRHAAQSVKVAGQVFWIAVHTWAADTPVKSVCSPDVPLLLSRGYCFNLRHSWIILTSGAGVVVLLSLWESLCVLPRSLRWRLHFISPLVFSLRRLTVWLCLFTFNWPPLQMQTTPLIDCLFASFYCNSAHSECCKNEV